MCNTAIRTPDGALEIIEHNIQVIYHLPKKYNHLDRALKDVRRDLLRLLNFCKNNEPIIWKQKYVWFMDNDRLTERLRKRTTYGTSSRHFNFLCCLGAIEKLKQTENSMTGVNMTFLLNERENGKIRPVNTFTVYKYTEKKLEAMEQRARELLEHKITPGNISNDKLKASGCEELAKEIYYANSEASIHNKEMLFQELLRQLENLCQAYGYTTKKELCEHLGWSRDKLDRILNIFTGSWRELYNYKAPNQEEMMRYSLEDKSWIITRR